MTENTDEIELGILTRKAQYYLENNLMVHLKFKNEGYKNGYINEIGSDFFFFDDRRLGRIIVFFIELEDIERYEVKDGDTKTEKEI